MSGETDLTVVGTVRDLDEFRVALGAMGHYVGWAPSEDEAERSSRLMPFDRLHAVFDGKEVVAGAGAFPLELTVPGGHVPCAAVTAVGVLPSHRRQGLLSRLMKAQLLDIRDRGEPVAALWASEEPIYGRFGYGLSSLAVEMSLPSAWAAYRPDLPGGVGTARLISTEDALDLLPKIYDAVQHSTVGFLSRSAAWWEQHVLDDSSKRRRGGGPLNCVLLELEGKPAGYALYRVVEEGTSWKHHLRVLEAIGVGRVATREIWRFLLDIDWVQEVRAQYLPADHPLFLNVARISKLELRMSHGLWLRPVDVGAALSARGYRGDGRATLEIVSDPVLPDNVGVWTIEDGVAKRSRRRADARLDVQALGAVYLGGFTFAELERVGRVAEVTPGGIARADALFATAARPWCPEMF